jgi:hypothetical protein
MTTSFRSFDNRREPLRHHAAFELQPRTSLKRRLTTRLPPRSPLLFERGTPHFAFEIAGKNFIYAYLRKNGCTSFKNFLLNDYHISFKNDLDKINQITLHRGVTKKSYDPTAHSLLILRDPIARICSLFRNKFIENPGSSYLPQRFNAVSGKTAENITFRQFVEIYLYSCILRGQREFLDAHCLPQAIQMWPIYYSHVFMLSDLRAAAHELFGGDVASAYFDRKVNATSMRFVDDEAVDIPASELRRLFEDEARTPSDAALLGADMEAALFELYAVDFALMETAGLPTRRPVSAETRVST